MIFSDLRGASSALLLACAMLGIAVIVEAQFVRGPIRFSPDVTLAFDGFSVSPQSVAQDDLRGGLSAVDGGVALPDGVRVTAYHEAPRGIEVFSVDRAVMLEGDLLVRPGDVVGYVEETFVIFLTRERLGLPPGALVDALSFLPTVDMTMIYSSDVSFAVGDVVVDDEDLLEIGPDPVAIYLDASAVGVASRLDVDGVHAMDDGTLLLSFDTSGSVEGIAFDDEDVLAYRGRGVWEMAFDSSARYDEWQAGDLAALSLPPELGCVGDCDDDGSVAINELILGVNIALGRESVLACDSLDANRDGSVAINELVMAVGNALSGCE